MYVDRNYRERFAGKDLVGFRTVIKDSDLFIMVDKESYSQELVGTAERKLLFYRDQLEQYIELDPTFKTTLQPHAVNSMAPSIAMDMARAGNRCGVGPMAAVAGAIAEWVGRDLHRLAKDVVIENGGDLFVWTKEPRLVGIFAGKSPFTNKIALKVSPQKTPLGICTSSGVVGPSLSFGKADAVVIISASTSLADAAATAIGNLIVTEADLTGGIEAAQKIPGLSGVVIIKEDKLACWGEVEIVPWETDNDN